jgi:hypothetical protein
MPANESDRPDGSFEIVMKKLICTTLAAFILTLAPSVHAHAKAGKPKHAMKHANKHANKHAQKKVARKNARKLSRV